MARRPRVFASGLLYHVIVRGNQRQKTFLTENDYQTYLERLARYREKYGMIIHAYCLMPNHVHLLVESSVEPLSKFMQGLQQSYTQYFNLKHNKVGHLFQGRYKAIVCQKDEYLMELVRYIHLNPLRAKMVQNPGQYKYSGHSLYLRDKVTHVLDPTKILRLMGGREAYRRFVLDGIGAGHKDEYYDVKDQRFLGAEGFGEKLEARVGGGSRPVTKRSLANTFKQLAGRLGTDPAVLKSPDRSWTVSKDRALIAYILVRKHGYRVGEVSAYLGRDMGTVSTLIMRFSDRVRSETEIKQKVDKLARIV